MLEHFISKVYNTKKLKGKAKGMVVTQDIVSAIRYYLAIRSILADKGNPFKSPVFVLPSISPVALRYQ